MINDPFSSAKHKSPEWYPQGMEEDIREPNSRIVSEINEEKNDSQFMEEDPENKDIGELDIQGLEQACNAKNFDKIPDQQVEDLEEILSRAHKQKSLGI